MSPVDRILTRSAGTAPAVARYRALVAQPHSGWMYRSASGWPAAFAVSWPPLMPACTWHSPPQTEMLSRPSTRRTCAPRNWSGPNSTGRVRGDRAHDLDRVRRGAADVGLRLHLGGGVDVGDDDGAGVLRLPRAQLVGGQRIGERAAGVRRPGSARSCPGERIFAVSAMKCTPQKTIVYCGRGRGDPRQRQRVADVVGDVLDLRDLVVVRQDDGVALGRASSRTSFRPIGSQVRVKISGCGGRCRLEVESRGHQAPPVEVFDLQSITCPIVSGRAWKCWRPSSRSAPSRSWPAVFTVAPISTAGRACRSCSGSGPGSRTPGSGRCPAALVLADEDVDASAARQLAEKVDLDPGRAPRTDRCVLRSRIGCPATGWWPPGSSGWCRSARTRGCRRTPPGTRWTTLPETALDHGDHRRAGPPAAAGEALLHQHRVRAGARRVHAGASCAGSTPPPSDTTSTRPTCSASSPGAACSSRPAPLRRPVPPGAGRPRCTGSPSGSTGSRIRSRRSGRPGEIRVGPFQATRKV